MFRLAKVGSLFSIIVCAILFATGGVFTPRPAEAGPLRFLGRVVSAPARFVAQRQPLRTFVRNRQPLRQLLPRNWGVRAYGEDGYASHCSNGACDAGDGSVTITLRPVADVDGDRSQPAAP